MTQDLESIRRFILGGQAIFTIVSKKTGDRKTFRVRKADDTDGSGSHGFFVDLLIGPNNTEDYQYLCFLWERATAAASTELLAKLNRGGWGSEAFTAFRWLLTMINQHFYTIQNSMHIAQAQFERMCEFHHAGFCSRCGRTLTDPESIEFGIGPVCRERAA